MAISYPPRVGTVFAERYQLRELLGSGGVGQVFRAWDVQAQRLIALKVFNPSGVSPTTWAAYAGVVAAALPLRHPDLVLPQGLPAALPPAPIGVMESLVGEDLATMRARLGKVPWQRAVEIGARCAEILHAVYAATGVAHRDLKASNVFVTQDGAVKLLDFGVAEFDVQSADRTRVDSALGVVDYKAPEQLEVNVGGFHADVFSLAVLVFEMVAGERPFAGASYFVVARKILLEPAPSLAEVAPEAGVPVALDALLQRALAKRPVDRFADLQAMHRAFTEVLRGAPQGSRTPRPAGRQAPQTAQPTPVTSPSRAPPRPPTGRQLATDEHTTMPATPRGPRRPGIRQTTGTALKQMVPSGAKAVVVAGDGEDPTAVNRVMATVVSMAPTSASPFGTPPVMRTVIDPGHQARRAEALADDGMRTQVVAHDVSANQPERTMILSEENVAGRPEATLMLPSDAPQPESTMMLPEEAAVPRPEGTMQMPEGTMAMPGEAARAAGGWTLQKTLIAINVACGLLILIGLMVLVFGGGEPTLGPEK